MLRNGLTKTEEDLDIFCVVNNFKKIKATLTAIIEDNDTLMEKAQLNYAQDINICSHSEDEERPFMMFLNHRKEECEKALEKFKTERHRQSCHIANIPKIELEERDCSQFDSSNWNIEGSNRC